jgi:hypothetical protein
MESLPRPDHATPSERAQKLPGSSVRADPRCWAGECELQRGRFGDLVTVSQKFYRRNYVSASLPTRAAPQLDDADRGVGKEGKTRPDADAAPPRFGCPRRSRVRRAALRELAFPSSLSAH